MILGLQFLAIVFAMIMVYFAFVNYKRKEINKIETTVWVGAWGIALYMILFPDSLRGLANIFFISRLLDVMIMGGFVLVITMVAIAYIRTKRIEKKVEELVRKEAFKKAKKLSRE